MDRIRYVQNTRKCLQHKEKRRRGRCSGQPDYGCKHSEGAGLTYQVSTHADSITGEPAWEDITAASSDTGNWQDVTPGSLIRLRANFSKTGAESPRLNSWTLKVKQAAAGEAKTVRLVDIPDSLSALSDANYMIQLRWQRSASDIQDGTVTYNVYRSKTPYFEIGDEGVVLVMGGLTYNYYSDYNTDYNQDYYYEVTAVKTINGHPRESEASNAAKVTVPDQNEIEKLLGLQNYWGYSGFSTGNGTGYVNVANGNVVYSSTDMVIPGPFFAITMRRTYNSFSTTKTALGYGWDYSFNTRLMKEVAADGTESLI
jgi:hypothetical protein